MPPKMLKSEDEVRREYNIRMSEEECTPLSHRIDVEGSCHCGFFQVHEPSGTFELVPNRRTRRLFSSFKRTRYTLTAADYERLKNERERDERRKRDRANRRAAALASVNAEAH